MKAINVVLYCLVLVAPGLSIAREAQKQSFRGGDITPATEYFSHFVRAVQKPFYLYHWRRDADLVQSAEVQMDPKKYGARIVSQDGSSFIRGLYAENRALNNMFGAGLYAALDPVTSESFGGKNPRSWAVLATRLPRGFQMIDLRIPEPKLTQVQTEDLNRTLQRFSCPAWHETDFGYGYVNDLFKSMNLARECADLVAHLLGLFKADGFLYSYTATDFAVCQNPTTRNLAVVFASSTWLNLPGAEAQVYTALTKANLNERRVLESTFLYTKVVNSIKRETLMTDMGTIAKLLNAKFPEANGTIKISHAQFRCDEPSMCATLCDLSYRLGNKDIFATVELKADEFDSLYLPTYPARFSTQYPNAFHWQDLEGMSTLKNPEDWIRKNLFECGDSDFLASPEPDQL